MRRSLRGSLRSSRFAPRSRRLGSARSILVIVGPEGGFSHEEADAAIAAGAHAVSLGSRILRTETAPLVILTAILYEGGEL